MSAITGYPSSLRTRTSTERAFLGGSPPKVIWIRRGNCTTADIGELLRSNLTQILTFGADQVAAFLALS